MSLQNILKGARSGPYSKPPPLKFQVLLEEEQDRVISWIFKNDTAVPAVVKKNKLAVITDGDSLTKITLFEDFSSKVSQGKNYIIRGYHLRGENPPYHIFINKQTQIFRSSPVVCRDGLMEEANALLHPPSPHFKLDDCRGHRGLLSVEGKIVQLSTVKKVRSGREEVPLREVKLQEDQTSVMVTLWREAAIAILEVGAFVRFTHLRVVFDAEGHPLQSTGFTKVEMVKITEEAEGVEVAGVMETEKKGVLEILLASGRSLEILEELWAPLEDHFSKEVLFVNFKAQNDKIIEIRVVKGGDMEE